MQRDTKKRKSLRYVAFAEVTTRRKKPIGRVHFHFLIEDERSIKELKQFFVMACERAGLVENEDFQVRPRNKPLWNGKQYFDYVLKCGRNSKEKAILFRKVRRAKNGKKTGKKNKTATRVQKIFYSDWFKKTIKQIRKEIRAFMKARKEAKKRDLTQTKYVGA